MGRGSSEMRIDFALSIGNLDASQLKEMMDAAGIDAVIGMDFGTADPAFRMKEHGLNVIPGVSMRTADQMTVYIVGAVDLVCVPNNMPFNSLYELVFNNGGAVIVHPNSLPMHWERADASFTYINGISYGPKAVARVAGTGVGEFGRGYTECDITDTSRLVEQLRYEPHLFVPRLAT